MENNRKYRKGTLVLIIVIPLFFICFFGSALWSRSQNQVIYDQAIEHFETEEWVEAAELFGNLNYFKDSHDYLVIAEEKAEYERIVLSLMARGYLTKSEVNEILENPEG